MDISKYRLFTTTTTREKPTEVTVEMLMGLPTQNDSAIDSRLLKIIPFSIIHFVFLLLGIHC